MTKRIVIIASILLILDLSVVGIAGVLYDPQQRDIFGSSAITKQFTSAQSQYEMVVGVTGKKLVVDYMIFATGTAGSLYLSEGTTTKLDKIYGATNTTQYLDNCNIRFSSGEGIDVTTDIAANHTVYLEYHQE